MRIAVNDTELYFDVEGAGLVPDGAGMRERPVILALHGGPGFDHAYFKPALSALTDVAQVVYLDHRAQGRSARPPVETCTTEQMADDAAAFCRALGIERLVVLGQSFGGFVAMTMALRHPDVVGRLILVDTTACIDVPEIMGILEARQGGEARATAEKVLNGDTAEATMADFMRLVLPAYAHPTRQEVLADMARSSFNPEVGAFWFRHERPRYDLRGRLGEITVPALVVVGDYDWITPPSQSRIIAAGIPGAELVVIPDAGHFAFSERPEAFAAAVRRFLGTPVPA